MTHRSWPLTLPHPLTSFIGREPELAEARRLLQTTRLLTLTGTGGVGKTRLGQAVAAAFARERHGGVVYVDLATVIDDAQVRGSVAAAHGLRPDAGRVLSAPPSGALAAACRADASLLVLDGCEHLVGACAALADELLRACPRLRILATSRQPLGISGETSMRVPPLPVAPDSIRLFVERAQAVDAAFTLTDQDRAAVEQICRRLDGLPLAIELAAARIVCLSPSQIVGRLDDPFRLLVRGCRSAPPRFRTLRALIDRSHEVLSEQERILLRRLAVFPGNWTLDAAETICAGDGIDASEILDLLSALIGMSVVERGERSGAVRYWLLQIVRAYATERLRDAGEEAWLRDRLVAQGAVDAEQTDGAAEEMEPPQETRRRNDRTGRLTTALAPLTRREQDVALLVARGLTNRQIAAALALAEDTAANHIRHIRARLGLPSRLQLAVWVIERGGSDVAPAGPA